MSKIYTNQFQPFLASDLPGVKGRRIRTLLLICMAVLLWASVTVTPAYAQGGHTYIVQPGDTLSNIATRYGISVHTLAATNNLAWDDWLYVGQPLMIRSEASPTPTPSVPETPDPRVPDPLPALPLLPHGSSPLSLPSYARVIEDDVPVYSHPSAAALGLPPSRYLGSGFIWVSVGMSTTYEGQAYYEINTGEYVRAESLSFYTPSSFQGVALSHTPERPLAWILQSVQPQIEPEGAPNPQAPNLARYELVQIFATETRDDQVWYLVGPYQWINQIYVGKVSPVAPPDGIKPDEIKAGTAWVAVNLFEQTLTAYEGERMVYATLISSGLPGWGTPTGLSQVWLHVRNGKMSGAHGQPDHYALEDVPWTLYFNRDVALHTAYWHDRFGYRHSHGCVNLAPADARWLYEWAPKDLWVWVHEK